MKSRRDEARNVRYSAADLAYHRPHPRPVSSGDEIRLRFTEEPATTDPANKRQGQFSLINSFTKGFEHDNEGFIKETVWFEDFIRASDSGDIDVIKALKLNENDNWKCKLAKGGFDGIEKAKVRAWESMGTGQTFELEGYDTQALCIPPAPRLDSNEMIGELTELYWMALCRDIPLTEFGTNETVAKAIDHLNSLDWFSNTECCRLLDYEKKRKRGPFTASNIFRGNVKGDDCGFYVSQFLYAGSPSLGRSNVSYGAEQGIIAYGSITADQRVRIATPRKDYMTNWDQWLDSQNGANMRELETYVNVENDNNINRETGYRFITTPRDLATWVHYDALHEAYFNACLLLLGIKAPFDPGMPFTIADKFDKQSGFATFGGPHILNLVSEVATRALKAVRYQKYSVHRRARPEQIGGWVHRYNGGDTLNVDAMKPIMDTIGSSELMTLIKDHNHNLNTTLSDRNTDPTRNDDTWLLPMPFVEGSPMHPSYGSGHATVAGACVTILKAFFDAGYVLPYHYKPGPDGRNLVTDPDCTGMYTVETELNKLASNIAIGRDWAGVHWYSDQLESLRLGEQIALGILEEQKLTYGENFSMSVPLFDGTVVRI